MFLEAFPLKCLRLGGLEIESIKHLGRLARGEDRMSPYYSMIAEALIGLGSIVFGIV